MDLSEVLVTLVHIMIITFVPILGLAVRKRLMANAFFEEFLGKEEIVEAGVLFVEQVYKGYDGDQKLALAYEWISRQLEKYNLDVDAEEVEGLIESAVYKFKAGWIKYDEEEE